MAKKSARKLSVPLILSVPRDATEERQTRIISVVIDNRSASTPKQGANAKFNVRMTAGVEGQLFYSYELVARKVAPEETSIIKLEIPIAIPSELRFFWNDGTPKTPLYRAISGREAASPYAWNAIGLQLYGFQYGTQVYENAGAAFVNIVGLP